MRSFGWVCSSVMVVVGVSGCSTLLRVSDANIPAMDSVALCARYAITRQPEIRAEIARRHVLTDEELMAADAKRIAIGMSDLQLLCSWGWTPIVNTTSGAWGVHRQYVYRPCSDCSADYVYTENHRITAIQN